MRASSTQQSEYSKAARELALERRAGDVAGEIDRARRRQNVATAKMIIEKEAEPQDRPGPQAPVMRQNEAQRPDDMGRGLEQHFALDQRFAHQPEFIMLEIAQAAMDELGRGRGRGAGKIALLGEDDLETPPGCITRDAAAIDAAANDRQIEDARPRPASSLPKARFRFYLISILLLHLRRKNLANAKE